MLEDAIEQLVERRGLAGSRIVVAVSGGVDSVVLLHTLAALAERMSLTLLVAHIDHGLRGDESAADALFVEELAAGLGLPSRVAAVAPRELLEGRSNRERPTLQEAARELRYDALVRIATQWDADWIATGHHLDDQAETLLLRMLRGTSPDGLAGIPEVSRERKLVRPMLAVTREEILAYAHRHKLLWREDASNQGVAYARNRLRRHWLPGLAAEFNPQLARALGQLAQSQSADSQWIEGLVREAAAELMTRSDGEIGLVRSGWSDVPEPLALRVIRSAILEMGGGRDVTRTHLERVSAFLSEPRTGAVLELPAGLRIYCRKNDFSLRRVK